jgi:hypothetical protein
MSSELAQALVDFLNGETFSIDFTAARRAVPFWTLDELGNELRVSVFTGTKRTERITRGSFQKTYKPIVAVQKKLPAGDESELQTESDALQELVDEIEESLEVADFQVGDNKYTFQSFNEEQEEDSYGIEALRSFGVFAVPIVLEYVKT